MKLFFCAVLFSVGALVKAQEDYAFPDYWPTDYDNYDNIYNEADASKENTELKQTETSPQTDTKIQDLEKEAELQNDPESKEFDVMEDYQIEDNRSSSDEKEQAEEKKEVVADQESMPDNAKKIDNEEELAVVPLEETEKTDAAKENNEDDKYVNDDMWRDVIEDDVAPLPVPSAEDNKDIMEETKNILNEDTQNFDEQQAEKSVKEGNPESLDEQTDIDHIIEETTKLLGTQNFDEKQAEELVKEENPESLDEQANIDRIIEETTRLLERSDDAFETNDEDLFSENNDEFEEDTPAKVYADLNADLDKLFETLGKLSDDNSDEDDRSNDDSEYVDNVQDYEEKYGKPYKEDVVLSFRKSQDDAPEVNQSNESDKTADEDNNETAEKNEVSGDQDEEDDYENMDDSNLSDIFAENAKTNSAEHNELKESDETEEEFNEADENDNNTAEDNDVSDDKKETVTATTEKNIETEEIFDYGNNSAEPLDSEPDADDDIDSVIRQIFSEDIKELQPYGNDALIDEEQPKNEDAEEFESTEANNTKVVEDIEQKTVMVKDLSSAELSELMSQFAIAHEEDLDVHSESFATHVAPIHVTLSVDEPTVITSPDYPNPYPTNNIIDWIFDGPGTGIELNITEFAVNGAMGDYLLVKPGGLDESGQDGLIFSYQLTSERRYRFADVNRMFVRFEAKPGWQFMKGFSFSVKMIWSLPQIQEDLPEPEAVLNPPQETLTLNLAGLTLPRFVEIKEQFTELIADMAKAYIRDNDIDQGLNTTFEVTQITRTTVCNIRWPNYETCVEVTFGVPLHYEEETEPRLNAEDLDTMWTSYIIKEEFSGRLRSLGITEYAIPNDRTVLMVWLVIAAGVLISMAMLAFALWRFSCFEDYTRMKAYGDADSIQNEKRQLDLYPTPHQTLPPLYAENDYKWADDKYDDSTRVDMGGFSNKSYVRDELFDLDSDEDVITTRDRKSVISPKDFYAV